MVDPVDVRDEPPRVPSVTVDFESDSLRDYWLSRAAQHTHDVYAGVPLAKMPEDLRVYEQLLWEDRVDTVIEIGTLYGASALWFRDRLRTMRAYGRIAHVQVITIDIEINTPRARVAAADPSYADEITFIEADVCDTSLPDRVAGLLRPDARCIVIEDSAHVYETTRAALEGFARFVPPGGWFVVEDGCVDVEVMRLDEGWPRGVLPAVDDWLATEAGFAFGARRDRESYGVTCHPRGFLQRAHGPSPSS
jgi:cephalosporin hydroxylase